MAVGQAKLTFEADASKVTSKLTEQVNAALAKIDTLLGGVTTAAEREGAQAGKALGDGITTGAKKADEAIDNIGGDSLTKVAQEAAKAGQQVAKGISDGAQKAEQSLSVVDGRSLNALTLSAANAGSGLASSITKGASTASRALGTIDGSSLNLLSVSAANAGSAISSSITRGSAAASESVGGISSAFNRVTQAASQAGQRIRDSLSKPLQESKQQAGELPGIFSRIAGAAALVAGPMVVLKGGFDRLMAIQRAEIMFKSVGLSAQQTKDQMARLSEQVTGTSVSLADAAKYSAMFAQSGVQLGSQMDNSIKAFTALSSIAEGSGVDVGRVMQQISAQGKVTGEDMAQMADAGVNATKYLADSMGMSQAEVKKAITDGKITFDDFVKAVNMGTRDLAKQMGQTLPAKISNFKTALSNLGATIIEPFIPGITAAVEFGIAITKGAVAPLKALFGWLNNGSFAANTFKAALIGISAAISIGSLVGLVKVLRDTAIVSAAAAKAMQILNLSFLISGPGLIIAAIGGVVAAIVLLWRNSEGFRNFWIALWDTVVAVVSPAVNFVKQAWNELVSLFTGQTVFSDGALARLIGIDNIISIQNSINTVKIAWQELVTAFNGGDDGYGALARLIGRDAAEWAVNAIGSVKAAWGELVAALQGSDAGSSALSNIFGDAGAEVILGTLRMLGDTARSVWNTIKDLGSALWDVTSALGSAAWDAFKAVLSAVWDVVKALWDAFMKLWDALSPILMPVIKTLAVLMGGALLVGIVALIGALRIAAFLFEGLGKVITWLVENVFTPLIDIISTVVTWIIDQFGGAISGFVEFLGNLISGVINFFTGFGDTLSGLWDTLKAGWDAVWQWLQTSWETYGQPVMDVLQNAFLIVFGGILLAWDALKAKFDEVWAWLTESWAAYGQPVLDIIRGAWDWFFGVLKAGWDGLVSIFQTVWSWLQIGWQTFGQPIVDLIVWAFNGMVSGVTAGWEWIKARWSDLWNFVMGVYNTYIAPVVEGIKQKFTDMSNWIGNAINTVRGYITSAGNTIRGLYTTYVAPMVSSVINGFNNVVQTVSGWKDRIIGALSGAGSWLVGVGRQVVQGMINGIRSMVGNLLSAVGDFASRAIARAKSALGIHSPSREFRDIGINVGEGMVQGIQAMTPAVEKAAGAMSDVAPKVQVSPEVTATAVDVGQAVAAAPTSVGSAPVDGSVLQSEAPAAFDAAAQAMKSISDGTVVPMFAGLNTVVGGFSGTVAQQSLGVALPAFQNMAGGMAATQSGVINPTMLATQASTNAMAANMWAQVNGPILQALQYFVTLIRWSYTSGASPIFTSLVNSLQWVVNSFSWAVNSIGSAWSRIRELTASPVRFTIGTVFNDGLVGMWNSVSELLGTNKMSPYPLRFATGGYVRGPGGPTGDKIPALLSDKEYVLNAKAVQKIGVQNLNAMNSGAISASPNALRTDKALQAMKDDHTFKQIASRYAGGGIVEGSQAWKDLLRGYKWAQSRSGRPYVFGGSAHGAGGTDCSGFMSGIADVILGGNGARQWATGNFPGTQGGAWARGLAAGFSVGIRNGGPGGGHTAGTIGGVPGIPAVNVESGGSPSRVKFGAGAVGATDGYFNQHHHLRVIDGGRFVPGSGSGVSMVDVMAEAMKPFREKMDAAVREYGRKPGVISQLPGKAKDKLTSAAQAKIEKLMEDMGDPGGTGSERWRPMVKRAYARQGYQWTQAKEDAWIRQIQSESGGNPNIAQQIVDINGTGEAAGVGLGQMIPATFAAYRDPALPNDRRNPWAMINAMVRYGERKYGARLLSVIGHGHGYAHGGLMGEGTGLFHKTAIKPERVLSPEQTGSFERLVDWLTGGVTLPPIQPAGGSATARDYGEPRNTRQVMVTQNIVTADAKQAADAIENRLMALM